MKKLYTFLILCLLAMAAKAQVTVTATAGTAGPSSYATVSAAFAAINAGTHQGDVLITISANTTEPSAPVALLKSAAPSSYTSVLIMPSGDVTINSAATPTANRAVIELAGADNVTIDGDDPLTAGVRNLSIVAATSTNTGVALVRFSSNSSAGTDGADNNTIKNCILTGSRSTATSTTVNYGVNLSNYSTSSMTTGAYGNQNNSIENNLITRCYRGIYANGTSTFQNNGLQIKNNILGSTTAASNIGSTGIYVAYSASSAGAGSAVISGNEISVGDISASGSGYSVTVSGIELGTYNAGALVTGNHLHDIYQPSTSGYGANGILISGSTNCNAIRIANNIINNIVASKYTTTAVSTFTAYGIRYSAGATDQEILHNTIVLPPAQTGTVTNYVTYGISAGVSGVRILMLKNNIVVNQNVGTGTFAIYAANALNISAGAADHNNYYAASGNVGSYNGTVATSLADWQAASGQDANSFSLDPPFISASDLHLNNTLPTLLESGGELTAVITDFDGQVRPGPAGSVNGGASAPDIGADEFDGIPITPVSVTSVSASPAGNLCTAGPRTITAVIVQGSAPVTAVTLSDAYNGVAQTPLSMTNSSGNNWTAIIPAATPSNAVVTWSVTATDPSLTVSADGTAYQDEELNGYSITATATPAVVCSGSPATLRAEATLPLTGLVGAGTATSTGYESPFYHLYGGYKGQYILQASELQAAGFAAGEFSALALDVVTAGTTYTDFEIKVGSTGNTDLAGGLYSGAMTTVYSAATVTPVAGLNTFAFSMPFTWDGTSSLVIQICWSNNNTGGTSSSIKYTTTTHTSTAYYRADNATAAAICGQSAGSGVLTRRPSFTLTGVQSPQFSSFIWSDGSGVAGSGQSISVSPVSTTTYSVVATNAAGCSLNGMVTLTTNALPAAPTAVNSTQCGEQVPAASVISTTGNASPVFNWYDASSGGTLLQSGTASGFSSPVNTTTIFYVSESDGSCESARTPVTVTVNTPPAISTSGDVSVCLGESATLTVSSANDPNYTYVWTPGGSGNSITVSPVSTTTYSVTATDASGGATDGCATSATLVVTVNTSVPGAVTITPAGPVCSVAAAQLLTATGGTITTTGTGTAGSGTNVVSTTSYPNPFSAYYGGVKHQMLFTAAELTSMGMSAGSVITSVSFNLAAINASGICNDFTIRMGHSNLSALTGFVAGTTTVYNSTFTPAAAGSVNFTLTTPFTWNGTDNLVLETVHNAGNGGNGSGTTTYYTATAGNTVYYGAKDNVTPAGTASFDALATYSVSGASANRPNTGFGFTNTLENPITWSPSGAGSGLYTDAAATMEYMGGATNTVYALPGAAATFTATATAASGCTSSATVSIAPATSVYTVTGGGNTCAGAGVHVGLDGSQTGVNYQLIKDGAVNIGSPVAGTGSALDFGIQSDPGIYTVEASWAAASGCTGTMAGSASIAAGAVPASFTVSGGATTCGSTGTEVSLSGSESGVNYQLVKDGTTQIGAAVPGTGGPISFGTVTDAGTYTVTATSAASGCTAAMDGTAVLVVNDPPVITYVLSQPNNCNSNNGGAALTITGAAGPYTFLWSGAGIIQGVQDQTTLRVGPYTVEVTAANGCTASAAFSLSGPGGCDVCPVIGTLSANPASEVCAGSAVTLSATGLTDMGNTYGIEFKYSSTALADPYSGGTTLATVDNAGLTSGGSVASASGTIANAGNYYIYAVLSPAPVDPACRPYKQLTFTVNEIPAVTATPVAQTICSGTPITTIGLTGPVSGTTYSWTRDNAATVTGIAASGIGDIAGTLTNTTTAPVTVTFTITPEAAGCTGAPVTATVVVNPVPAGSASPVAQTICSGTAISDITFSGAVSGTQFNWTRDNTVSVTGIAASGNGTVSGILTNTTAAPVTVTFTIIPEASGCSGTSFSSTVIVNPQPTAVATPNTQTVCTGDAITPITLNGAVSGTVFNWTRNNTVNISGIPASGSGGISGTVTNNTSAQQTVLFTITPVANSCSGTPVTATVIVNAPPAIVCPANITVNNAPGQCGAVVNYPAAVATGTPVPVVTYSIPSGSTFPVGVTTVTATATNACGTATCSFTITVNDTQAPVITCPGNINATAVGACTALVNYSVTATDNCTGVTVVRTAGPASGTAFPIGITTVTHQATDASGNSSTCSFTVTVVDGQLPVINTQPVSQTVCAGANATFSVTAANALSYQWQQWNGSAWANISGATASAYTFSNVSASLSTTTVRVQVNGRCNTATSAAATLRVNALPVVSISASGSTQLLPGQSVNITAVPAPSGAGSYAWYVNSTPVPGATTAVLSGITVDQAGAYNVVYTNSDGCSVTSSAIVISAMPSAEMYIMPNPNNGQFDIRVYNAPGEELSLRIYDAAGALVYARKVAPAMPYSSVKVDLQAMGIPPAGIYHVVLFNKQGLRMGAKQLVVFR